MQENPNTGTTRDVSWSFIWRSIRTTDLSIHISQDGKRSSERTDDLSKVTHIKTMATKTGSETCGFLAVCVHCCRHLLTMAFAPKLRCFPMQDKPVSPSYKERQPFDSSKQKTGWQDRSCHWGSWLMHGKLEWNWVSPEQRESKEFL